MATKKVEKKDSSDKKIRELEGLVLASRFGARTIWGGLLTTLISTVVFIVVLIPVAAWLASSIEQTEDKKIIIMAGGGAATITLLAVVVVYYVAMMVGVIRMVMGLYRIAHPEKYTDRALSEK